MTTTTAAQLLVDLAVREGLKPPPELEIDEWADKYRRVTTGETAKPGKWSYDRTPFIRAICRCLGKRSPYENVVVMKGAQVGMSEVILNWLGWTIDLDPSPFLIVQPNVEPMGKRFSKQRLAPMIRETPCLRSKVRDNRSRDSDNTVLEKGYPGGRVVITGANSAAGLRQMPSGKIALDDLDEFDYDVDNQGDPVEQAIRRSSWFGRRRRILYISTPTLKDRSRIEGYFLQGDQRYCHLPCPDCGVFSPLKWADIVFTDNDPKTTRRRCPHCSREHGEQAKARMFPLYEWVASAPPVPKWASFHLSSLYAPLGAKSWAQIVESFIQAKRKPEKLKVWTNTDLGETYEEEGSGVEFDELLARAEVYDAEVPAPVLVLYAGVDVQQDRLEAAIWGVSDLEELYAIDYLVLHGDPEKDDVWAELDEALSRKYVHASGVEMRISATGVDTGYLAQKVYGVTTARAARHWYAVKGVGTGKDGQEDGKPLVSAPQSRRYGRERRPAKLFFVNTDQAKRTLYTRLHRVTEGEKWFHWPAAPAFDEEYFRQLCSERLVTRFFRGRSTRIFVRHYARQEVLDTLVYAFAMLHLRPPNFEKLAAKYGRQLKAKKKKRRPGSAVVRPTRGKNWVKSW